MQPNRQKSASDEEDDLESLRLAALQSLKRPTTINPNAGTIRNTFNKKLNKRRFNHIRTNRNGPFNHRIRNTTLITVPTIESNEPKDVIINKIDNAPKLVLPQDRYCNTKVVAEDKLEVPSKFDRYNDSESDSDSDSNDENSEPSKLVRSNSLEALMQELENEIQGESKPTEDSPPKPKKIKKAPKTREETVPEPLNIVEEKVTKIEQTIKEEPIKIVVKSPPRPIHRKKPVENSTSHNLPIPTNTMYSNTTQVPFQPMPYSNYAPPLCPPVAFDTPLSYPYPALPLIGTNDLNLPHQPVFVKYDNPLPSISINTDVLNTISAPLSPRSAAFVLQNREIIERRKKSPRRSYSRSPSPRYRRSNSRSVSPIRRSSPKSRRPQTYKRSSPSISNRSNQSSPKRVRRSPLRSARSLSKEKVNTLPNKSPSISLSSSPSPERSIKDENKDSNTLDPVLEARRRKFENGAVPTEGIIRLRPKNEENEEATVSSTKDEPSAFETDSVEVSEDELPAVEDEIDFNVKLDDLFSDEESDSENEGRFKSKQNSLRVVSVKPFTQIANGITSDKTKKESDRDKVYKSRPYGRDRTYERDRKEGRRSSRSPPREVVKKDQDSLKSLMSLKIDIPRKKNITESVSSKPVEDHNEENIVKSKKETVARRVEVASIEESVLEENSDSDDDTTNINADGSGDLRAQLSRKRAERQHMVPKAEKIVSRLLQSALQGVVYKKVKKSKKKEKDLTTDGKVPIHLRLGIPGSFNVNELKSSGKRSKSRTKYEQV